MAYFGNSTVDVLNFYISSKVSLARLRHEKPDLGWPYDFVKLQEEFVLPVREAEKDALEGRLPIEGGVTAEHLGQMVAIAKYGFSKKSTIEAIREYHRQLQTAE